MADIDDDDLNEDRKTSTFLQKTFNMVSDPANHHIVCWNDVGDEFIVKNEHDFASILLPLHFRHKNFSSFVRQLNFYGFRKRSAQSQYSHFKHPNFRRDRRDLLQYIKRKVTESTNQNTQVKDTIEGLQQQISTLQRQYEDIWKVQHHILFVLSRYMSQDSADPRLPAQSYNSNSFIEHIKDFPDSQSSGNSTPLATSFPALPLLESAGEERPAKRPHTAQFQYGSGQQYTVLPTRGAIAPATKTKGRADKDAAVSSGSMGLPGAITWKEWESVQNMFNQLPPPHNMTEQALPVLPQALSTDALSLAVSPPASSGHATRSTRRRSVATIEEIQPADDELQQPLRPHLPLLPPQQPVLRGLGSSTTSPANGAMQGGIRADFAHSYGMGLGGTMTVGADAATYPTTMTGRGMGSTMGGSMHMMEGGLMPPASPASTSLVPPALSFMPSDLMPVMTTGLITHEPDTHSASLLGLAPTAPLLAQNLAVSLSSAPGAPGDPTLMSPLLPTTSSLVPHAAPAATTTHAQLSSFPYPALSPAMPALAPQTQPGAFTLPAASTQTQAAASSAGATYPGAGYSASARVSDESLPLLPALTPVSLAPSTLTTSLTSLEQSLRSP